MDNKTPVPYMVVVRDQSTYQIPVSSYGKETAESSGMVMASEVEGESEGEQKEEDKHAGEFVTKNIYPQVKYVFANDDFNPTLDVLEGDDNEVSVIVDFDENQNLLRAQSFSADWQVINATMSNCNAPQWMPDQDTKKLYIDGTSSTTTTMRKPKPHGTLQDTHDLIEAIKDRSQQLNQLLYNDKEKKEE